jgi:hypothetical protein
MMKNITLVGLLFFSISSFAQEKDSTNIKNTVFVHKSKEKPSPISPKQESKLEVNPTITKSPVKKTQKINR